MLIFRIGIPLLFSQLLPFFATAQDADTSAAPAVPDPDPYTFEIADSLVHAKKYERAVWTYINLFPRAPDSVVAQVRLLESHLSEAGLPAFIQTTFARFAPMDPAIATFDFSGPTLDSAQLKIKADWSDALIRRLAPDSLGMDSFSPK